MPKITISSSKEYDVIIKSGALEDLPNLLPLKPQKAVIVSDERVAPLYLEKLKMVLKGAEWDVHSFVVPEGESSKSIDCYARLLSFCAINHITRSDALFALGGGVVGDLTGFTAASYLRGISFVQIPTTLLAAVDSSVGGKTAVNLPEGKNLVGCFYQPSCVVCDIALLATLSDDVFKDGCAEIIKYAVLGNSTLFDELEDKNLFEKRTDTACLEKIIARCVEMKRDIVTLDEKDTSIRNILNLGHTFGHAIETCSGFTVSHGHGVAIGMTIASHIAEKHGICEKETVCRIEKILSSYGLPTETQYSYDELFEALKADKKISNGFLKLIMPKKIGECVTNEIEINRLYEYLKV